MRANGLLATCSVLLLKACIFPVRACNHRSSSTGQFTIGDDGPADPATLGYTLNHMALLVEDMKATKQFYGEVLGMREIFTFRASDAYEIIYMGYSHGGKNGTGFQTGEELYAEKTNSEGLIEFLSFKDSSELLPSTKSVNTLSHVGLVVPDIRQTQARMEQHGVKIFKPVGEDLVPGTDAARAYGLRASLKQAEAVAAGIQSIGFENFLLVADPDGNLVEIQNQS